MAKGSTNRLLALLGVGALAYWRYTKSSPEEKQKVKDTIDTAKKNLSGMGDKLKEQANQLKGQVTEKIDSFQHRSSPATAGAAVNAENPTATQEGDYYQSQSQNN